MGLKPTRKPAEAGLITPAAVNAHQGHGVEMVDRTPLLFTVMSQQEPFGEVIIKLFGFVT